MIYYKRRKEVQANGKVSNATSKLGSDQGKNQKHGGVTLYIEGENEFKKQATPSPFAKHRVKRKIKVIVRTIVSGERKSVLERFCEMQSKG